MTNNLPEEQYWKVIGELSGREVADYLKSRFLLDHKLDTAKSYYQKLLAIKAFYIQHENEILETHNRGMNKWFSSYPTDWNKLFTPIEDAAWQSIRSKGKIVLYPQYPVLNYFLDFANPGLKIGLELDGAQYHDEARDKIRDAELKKSGWTIYRIPGKEMMRTNYKEWSEIEDEYSYEHENIDRSLNDIRYWILETGDGVIEAIKETYFHKSTHRKINETVSDYYYSYCEQTLENHSY